MIAIIEFFFFLLFLPFLLFGMILSRIKYVIAKVFEPTLLLTATWLGIFGAWLMTSATPDDSQNYVTMVELVAQSHVGPLSTPATLLCAAVLLCVASAMVAAMRRRKI